MVLESDGMLRPTLVTYLSDAMFIYDVTYDEITMTTARITVMFLVTSHDFNKKIIAL